MEEMNRDHCAVGEVDNPIDSMKYHQTSFLQSCNYQPLCSVHPLN